MSPTRALRTALVLVVLLTLALIGGALPASAHVFGLDIDDTAQLVGGDDVLVTGSLGCHPNERWFLVGRVTQDEASGTGTDDGFCTGSRQSWEFLAESEPGSFDPGPALVCVEVRTFVGGSQHGTAAQHCETVTIV